MPRKGYRQTAEHIALRAAQQIGRRRGPMAEAQKEKLRVTMRGRTLTPEHRAKVVQTLQHDARRGDTWKWPDEVKQRISVANVGKHSGPWQVIGECVYCGGPATTRDHVIPRTRGGSDDASNIVLACHPCNASKGTQTPEEWIGATAG